MQTFWHTIRTQVNVWSLKSRTRVGNFLNFSTNSHIFQNCLMCDFNSFLHNASPTNFQGLWWASDFDIFGKQGEKFDINRIAKNSIHTNKSWVMLLTGILWIDIAEKLHLSFISFFSRLWSWGRIKTCQFFKCEWYAGHLAFC